MVRTNQHQTLLTALPASQALAGFTLLLSNLLLGSQRFRLHLQGFDTHGLRFSLLVDLLRDPRINDAEVRQFRKIFHNRACKCDVTANFL